MNQIKKSLILSTGLAIFSMFFGAGNLIFPLMVGRESGNFTIFGMIGFLLTAVFLPMIGLIAIIFFDGNYESFFKRLGNTTGACFIGACMMIIGPVIAIPRITTLSHIMIAPFVPIAFLQTINPLSSFIFALIFLGITFLATFRENKIIEILGNVISPTLLISLFVIIIRGLFTEKTVIITDGTPFHHFKINLIRGYETLDLLGGIFFGSIILSILKKTTKGKYSTNQLAWFGFKSSLIGVSLLGLVYSGMSFLGAFFGHGLEHVNAGELFREIAFIILGSHGATLIAITVLMACLSTAIALAAIIAEYTQKTIFKNNIHFVHALIITLLFCIPLSTFGLEHVMELTGGPILYIGYPIIITITLCNIAYKLFNFKPIIIPVFLTFCTMLISYFI